jgi:hypothetical protein
MRLTDYTVLMLLLMAFTIGMIVVRIRKPADNNWPAIYWALILVIALRWPEAGWNPRAVMTGAAAGFLVRFEFMNDMLVRLLRLVEFGVWIYILHAALLSIL